jgi:hypothetical protein
MGLKKPNKVEAATTVKEVEQEAVLVHEEKVVEETAAAETVAEKTVAPEVKEVAAEKVEPEAKEVEQEAEPEVQTAKPETALAKTSEANTQVAKDTSTGDAFIDQMASEGFAGLELSYRSYTSVKLDGNVFVTSEDVELEGKSFQTHLMGSKPRWAYLDSKEREGATCIFSVDQVFATDGTPLADTIAEWKAEGKPVIIKNFVDLTVEVLSGELEGEIVVLSIPTSSIPRLTGHMGRLKYRGVDAREAVTEVSVAKRVTMKGSGDTFYPWDFKLVKD